MDIPAESLPGFISDLKKHAGGANRLARLVRVSPRVLGHWSSGKSYPQPNNIEQLLQTARDLRIDPELYAGGDARLWDCRHSYDDNVAVTHDIPTIRRSSFRDHRIHFLGRRISSPIGASASVLTSRASQIRFLSNTGLDVLTYKTVRARSAEPHRMPNILYVAPRQAPRESDRGAWKQIEVADPRDDDRPRHGMVNRFGIPSADSEIWMRDFGEAKRELHDGQLLILSVVGTAGKGAAEEALIADFVGVAQLAIKAGADVLELNLSCPSSPGKEALVYHNPRLAKQICASIRKVAGHTKLLAKVGPLPTPKLRSLVLETCSYLDGYSAVNSLPLRCVRRGPVGLEPAFGRDAVKAGLSGRPILQLGLRAVADIASIRAREGLSNLALVGIGGISEPQDVLSYLNAGADVVQFTTALFVDPRFGARARKVLDAELCGPMTLADHVEEGRSIWSRAVEELLSLPAVDPQAIERAALGTFQDWRGGFDGHGGQVTRRLPPMPTVREFTDKIRSKLGEA